MKEYPVYIGGFHHFTREQLAKAGIFIAHDFFGDDDTTRGGYRNKFDVAFRDTPYMPVYAPIDSGTILETLTQSMVNCFAGIFDVTTNRRLNANVLIELGVCLAINHPAIVVAEGTDPLPDFLETLRPLRYTGRRDLRDQLSQQLDERIAESQRLQHGYCVICRRTDCECRTSVPVEDKTYMLLGAHIDADEVDIDVEEALLHFDLKRLQIAANDALNLCVWLRLIKRVRFALFYSKALGKAHHGDENAATMLQLGLAVGSPTPWRIIVPVDEFPPTDVSAFMAVIRNPNARIFQDRISGAASKLLEEFNPLRVVNISISRPDVDGWEEDEPAYKKTSATSSLPRLAALYNVPSLPKNFVARQEMIDEIVHQLTSKTSPTESATVAAITGIAGVPGIGKSSLAVAVCHDERIRHAFPDGIYWLSSGANIESQDGILTLVQAISNETIASTTLRQATAKLSELVHNQSILIVIDDVWKSDAVRSIVVPSPRSAYLLTTRNSEVLQQLNASITQLEIDQLSESEAIQFLTAQLSSDEMKGNLPRLRELLQATRSYPLALELLLEQIAIEGLSERTRYLFQQLGIFAENVDIPLSSVARLWQLNDFETEDICRHLAQQSLLNLAGGNLSVDDVIRTYLISKLEDAAQVHARLLDSWGNPYTLPDDYSWRFYIYHAINAGRVERARELLQDAQWLQAKLDVTDVDALLTDFAFLNDDPELSQIAENIETNRTSIASGLTSLHNLLNTPQAKTKASVFIVYRRSVSLYLARSVYKFLINQGFDVFLDVASIQSSNFDQIILRQIATRDFVLVMMTEGTFERANNPDDWLRKELLEAYRLQKTIIPIIEGEFSSRELPDALRFLEEMNWLFIKRENFETDMQRLVRNLELLS